MPAVASVKQHDIRDCHVVMFPLVSAPLLSLPRRPFGVIPGNVGGIEFHHQRWGIVRSNIADRAGGFRGRGLCVWVLSGV